MERFILGLDQYEKDQQKAFYKLLKKIEEGYKKPDNSDKPLSFFVYTAFTSALVFKTMKNVLTVENYKEYIGMDYFLSLNDIFDLINVRTKVKLEIIKNYSSIAQYQMNNKNKKVTPVYFVDIKWKTMTPNYIISELFEGNNFEIIVNSKSNKLYEIVSKIKDVEFGNIYDKEDLTILNEFFNKESFERKDIEDFILSLSNVGLNEDNTREIREYLYVLLEKRKSKKEKEISKSPIFSPIKKKGYSEKEEREIYDFKKNEFLKNIDNEQMYECLKTLMASNRTDREINTFLNKYYDSLNSIAEYISKREKYMYYGMDITYMDELLHTLISSDITSEDYLFWKKEFVKELNDIETLIPKNYNFERIKVKRKIIE